MRFKRNRFYKEGAFHHLYVKALNGNVLFYRTADYLFIYTLFSILTKRHGIKADLFCIMFNHLHGSIKAKSLNAFRPFLRDLSSMFTAGYNKEYHLSGQLLMECGYAAKTSTKAHKTNLIYIANNPSAGRLTRSHLEYKWGLIPYYFSDHPFSEKLVKRKCRFAMRQALSMVDRSFNKGLHLGYTMLENIYCKLDAKERAQMTDYIIVKYFFLDKDSFVSTFGSLEKALIAIESSSGSEQDFYEPWEDYSVYLSMLKKTLGSGLDFRRFRFHEMPKEDLMVLYGSLSGIPGVTNKHISRFLHLDKQSRDLEAVDY